MIGGMDMWNLQLKRIHNFMLENGFEFIQKDGENYLYKKKQK